MLEHRIRVACHFYRLVDQIQIQTETIALSDGATEQLHEPPVYAIRLHIERIEFGRRNLVRRKEELFCPLARYRPKRAEEIVLQVEACRQPTIAIHIRANLAQSPPFSTGSFQGFCELPRNLDRD